MAVVEGSVHSAAAAACLPANRISSRLYLLITWSLWSTHSTEEKDVRGRPRSFRFLHSRLRDSLSKSHNEPSSDSQILFYNV